MKMVEDRQDLYWKKFEKPNSGRLEGKKANSVQ